MKRRTFVDNIGFSKNEKIAFDRGYYYSDGDIFTPLGKKVKQTITQRGYYRFSIRTGGRKRIISTHRLVAYQKYGDKLYSHSLVRHRDGCSTNNSPSNITLGDQRENMMDISEAHRREKSIKAAGKIRRYSNAEVEEIRQQHRSYPETISKYGMPKSTLWEVLNRNYVTDKTA